MIILLTNHQLVDLSNSECFVVPLDVVSAKLWNGKNPLYIEIHPVFLELRKNKKKLLVAFVFWHSLFNWVLIYAEHRRGKWYESKLQCLKVTIIQPVILWIKWKYYLNIRVNDRLTDFIGVNEADWESSLSSLNQASWADHEMNAFFFSFWSTLWCLGC